MNDAKLCLDSNVLSLLFCLPFACIILYNDCEISVPWLGIIFVMLLNTKNRESCSFKDINSLVILASLFLRNSCDCNAFLKTKTSSGIWSLFWILKQET